MLTKLGEDPLICDSIHKYLLICNAYTAADLSAHEKQKDRNKKKNEITELVHLRIEL